MGDHRRGLVQLAVSIFSLISALILDRPMRLACLASKAELSLMATDEVLSNIGRSVEVTTVPRSTCSNCGKVAMTYCIGGRPEMSRCDGRRRLATTSSMRGALPPMWRRGAVCLATV